MEEILTNESTQENVEDGINYIEAINEMKKNSVSRDKYNKLEAENKKLLDALVTGKQIETPKEKVDVQALIKKTYSDNPGTNLEYISNVLKIREAMIDAGERDPFTPFKPNNVPVEPEDQAIAERVAAGLQEMVDYSNGDNDVFLSEFQRVVYDVNPMAAAKRGRK